MFLLRLFRLQQKLLFLSHWLREYAWWIRQHRGEMHRRNRAKLTMLRSLPPNMEFTFSPCGKESALRWKLSRDLTFADLQLSPPSQEAKPRLEGSLYPESKLRRNPPGESHLTSVRLQSQLEIKQLSQAFLQERNGTDQHWLPVRWVRKPWMRVCGTPWTPRQTLPRGQRILGSMQGSKDLGQGWFQDTVWWRQEPL